MRGDGRTTLVTLSDPRLAWWAENLVKHTSVFWTTKNIELSAVFHRLLVTTATTAVLVMDKVHETHSGRHNRPKMTAFALNASF